MASWGERGTRSHKEGISGLWDNSYRFPGMEIAIDKGGIDEELREAKFLLAIRLDSILNTGERRSEQNADIPLVSSRNWECLHWNLPQVLQSVEELEITQPGLTARRGFICRTA